MANKFIIPLTPVVGVVPGQTATLDVPIGPRYHVIWLEAAVKKTSGSPALTTLSQSARARMPARRGAGSASPMGAS